MKKYFKIGEISKLYNIGVDSLRYYETIGIIHPERTEAGYRLYSIKDISKLNIIRDLLELGFNMESIKHYLNEQDIATSLDILKDEKKIIEEKIKHLQMIEANVSKRIKNIESCDNLVFDEVKHLKYAKRSCFTIDHGYKSVDEMDVLMKALLNKNPEQLYIMGNNKFGTIFSKSDLIASDSVKYNSVFIIDDSGDDYLDAGEYLSIFYRGPYTKSHDYAKILMEYAKQENLELDDNFLEILWIDIHTSNNEAEFITELQILIKM